MTRGRENFKVRGSVAILETSTVLRSVGAALCVLASGPALAAAPSGLARTSAHQPAPSTPPSGWPLLATATQLLAPVYDSLGIPRYAVGSVQRGTAVAARKAKSTEPCHDNGEAGSWYEIPGGYVCSASGYAIGARAESLSPPQRLPDLSQPVPFPFVKVTTPSSIRYDDPATDKEAIAEYQTKAYFLAVDKELEVDGKKWIKTVYDEFVQADELKPVEPTRLVGEKLGASNPLPIAFVYGDPAGVEVECEKSGRFSACGRADKHSRFSVRGAEKSGRLQRPDGKWVSTEHLRVIRKIARPQGVPADARWVHVDLSQQAFIAYEGNTPVYTSLISSGISGFDTPNGLHRVYRKYVTKTMRGPDPDAGRYRVEEIPWVMYYDGNYALHGAYWHDNFGDVRSHGCTNIAPADAKWLYEWGTGDMPPGWHASYKVQDGTWVYLTGGADRSS